MVGDQKQRKFYLHSSSSSIRILDKWSSERMASYCVENPPNGLAGLHPLCVGGLLLIQWPMMVTGDGAGRFRFSPRSLHVE